MAPRKTALPKPLPEGFILADTEKKKWRLGKIIGQGGFGLIYLASRDVDRPVAADSEFVIKLEYQENGPLFSELKFYQRAAKPESMLQWKKSRKLDFLGIPTYWGSGLAEHNDLKYRFMAMDRLGSDLQKVCEKNGGRLKKATVLQLGQGLVSVLEYIHEHEYVHADIKAANLMLGYRDPEQVYLADYGLSYRYCPDGDHKAYKENPKKGHNGTIEYTSIDAHKGLAPSRRGDMQILGFCLLHWLCGSLPWDDVLKSPTQVQEAKTRLMDNLPGSVQQLSVSGASTDEVAEFLLYVKTLDYQEKPDYQHLQKLLGSVSKGKLDLSVPDDSAGKSTTNKQDPPTKEKKAGRSRRPSKAKPAATDEELQERKSKKIPVGIRGPPITRPQSQQDDGASAAVSKSQRSRNKSPVAYQDDDTDDEDSEYEEEEEEEEEMDRPRPIPPGSLRRPPIGSGKQPKQKDDGASAAVSRNLRRRSPVSYKEDDSEEEVEEDEDEEEETDRPRPIPSAYLRGPPKGPRKQPKQRTKSKWSLRVREDFFITEQLHHPQWRTDRWTDGQMDSWERPDERVKYHRGGHSSERRWRDSEDGLDCGVCRESSHRGLEQRKGFLSWFVFVGAVVFLGAVLGVGQSAF